MNKFAHAGMWEAGLWGILTEDYIIHKTEEE